MGIDLTQIFEAFIALAAAVATHKLVPWIKSKVSRQQFENLCAMAKASVYAAEQIFEAGDNEKKLGYAIERLKKAGFEVDEETLREAVEKAVFDLKTGPGMAAPVPAELKTSASEAEHALPPLSEWPLEMPALFCKSNGIPHGGCGTKDEYVDAILSGAPSEAGRQPDGGGE